MRRGAAERKQAILIQGGLKTETQIFPQANDMNL